MKKRYIWTIVTIFFVLFIYSNSIKPAVVSSVDSGRVLRIVRECLITQGVSTQWLTEHFVRKMGHFSEYAVLGILLFECLRSYEFTKERRHHIHLTAGYMIPFIDETIQLFINGRSGQISDVWLDCSGIVFTTLFMTFFYRIYKKTGK